MTEKGGGKNLRLQNLEMAAQRGEKKNRPTNGNTCVVRYEGRHEQGGADNYYLGAINSKGE